MRVSDYSDIHREIETVRSLMIQNGAKYEDFDPVKIAARVVAVCDSKNKLKSIIKNLKELLVRYELYYEPRVFNNERKD